RASAVQIRTAALLKNANIGTDLLRSTGFTLRSRRRVGGAPGRKVTAREPFSDQQGWDSVVPRVPRPASDRRDGVGAFHGLPAERLPGQNGGGISTLNSRGAGLEAEDQVEVAVLVEVSEGRAHRDGLGASPAEPHGRRIHGGGVERVGRQNGDG